MATQQTDPQQEFSTQRATSNLLDRFRLGRNRVVQNHAVPGNHPPQQPNQPVQQAPQGGQQAQRQQQQAQAGGGGGGNQRNVGGGGGGGGNNPPVNNQPVDSDRHRKMVLTILTLCFGFIALMITNYWWDRRDVERHNFYNTPAGMEEKKQETLKRETEKLEAQTELARASAPVTVVPHVVARPIPAPVTPPQGMCVSPHPEHTTFEQPIVLTAGTCVTLRPASAVGEYFYAKFQKAPSMASGVAEFLAERYTGTLTADGHKDVEAYDSCVGNCTDFFARHNGEVILVRQTVGQALNIKI